MLACSALTFTVGGCTSGMLIWWKFERIFQQQQEHIKELRKRVKGLMNAPMPSPQGVLTGDPAYVQELYCKELWSRPSTSTSRTRTTVTLTTSLTSTSTSSGTTTVVSVPDTGSGSCVRTCELRREQHQASVQILAKRWAYVMLSQNTPGNPEHLWGVVAVANALQRLGSQFPLVLLTNTTQFPDGTSVAEALRNLNVVIRPVYAVDMPEQHAKQLMYQHWKIAYWKLQIWNLTDYEKLIWLDSDTILYRSIDWLFDRQWMWAQRDDWFCKLNVSKVCSGIVLLYPNASDFQGLLDYADQMGDLTDGDQQLISSYFATKRNMPIQLLSDLEAAFGQCIGRAPAPYINSDGTQVRGVWNVPSFVHKSGGWGDTNGNLFGNACFMPNISVQLYSVGKATLNVCQYHPLGAYWRSTFCDAIARLGIRYREVNVFCNDECWYRGRPPTMWRKEGGLEARDWHLCGVVNATLSYPDYYARKVGWPPSEGPG